MTDLYLILRFLLTVIPVAFMLFFMILATTAFLFRTAEYLINSRKEKYLQKEGLDNDRLRTTHT